MRHGHPFVVTLLAVAVACRPDVPADRPTDRAPSLTVRADAPSGAPDPAVALRRAFADSLLTALEASLRPAAATMATMVAAVRADSGTRRADSTFLQFVDSLDSEIRAEYLQARGSLNEQAASGIADSLVRMAASRGVRIVDGEGGPHFAVSMSAMSQSVGRLLSPAGRDYLSIVILEESHPFAQDASLMISWNELGDRLAAADRFVVDYPDSPFTKIMHPQRESLLRFYLRGWPSLDGRVRSLPSVVGANIEAFLARHGATSVAASVRAYRDALAAQGYRGGATLDELLRARLP